MKDALRNLFELNPQNLIIEVYISLLIIWVLVVIAGLWSILGSRSSGLVKFFWSIIVLGLPLVGMLAYAFYCALQLDFKMLGNRAQAARQLHAAKRRNAAGGSEGITT